MKSSPFNSITIVIFLFIFLLQNVLCLERKLISSINPNCNVSCEDYLIIHTQSIGPNDTLHYLSDFSEKPSFILALTTHETNLSIDWNNLKNQTSDVNPIEFNGNVYYTFGILINKIIEFNDVNDTAHLDMNNGTLYREYKSNIFNWKKTKYLNESNLLELEIEASGQPINRTGILRFIMNCYGYRDHSPKLPHLLHSSNSSLIELEIDNLSTDPSFNRSRFAVEIIMTSQDSNNSTMYIDLFKSLDDEHTPGVFTMVNLLTPKSKYSSSGGFLQWRPVTYVSKDRSISNSTETFQYNIENIANPADQVNESLILKYYGNNLSVSDLLIQKTYISFGLKEDGFYKKSNFNSWSFIFGYGKPPNENFSLLVILVISIGLGLPTLLIIISGVVMAMRRISRNKDELFVNS